jgi:hypothetical protein
VGCGTLWCTLLFYRVNAHSMPSAPHIHHPPTYLHAAVPAVVLVDPLLRYRDHVVLRAPAPPLIVGVAPHELPQHIGTEVGARRLRGGGAATHCSNAHEESLALQFTTGPTVPTRTHALAWHPPC